MTPERLNQIREAHEAEERQRIQCGCSLCMKHQHRGELLAEIEYLQGRVEDLSDELMWDDL